MSGRGQGTELHRFEEIYSAIVNNCLCRQLVIDHGGRVDPGKVPGWDWVLEQWFAELRRLAGGREGGDVPGLRLMDVIEQAITSLRRRSGLHGGFSEALRQEVAALTRRTWATRQQARPLLAHLEWWRA